MSLDIDNEYELVFWYDFSQFLRVLDLAFHLQCPVKIIEVISSRFLPFWILGIFPHSVLVETTLMLWDLGSSRQAFICSLMWWAGISNYARFWKDLIRRRPYQTVSQSLQNSSSLQIDRKQHAWVQLSPSLRLFVLLPPCITLWNVLWPLEKVIGGDLNGIRWSIKKSCKFATMHLIAVQAICAVCLESSFGTSCMALNL